MSSKHDDADVATSLDAMESWAHTIESLFEAAPDLESIEPDHHHLARNQLEPEAVKAQSKVAKEDEEGFLADLELTEPQTYEIYKYLASMPKCVEVMKKQRGDEDGRKGGKRPLADTHVIVIHHLDDKAFGAMAVLREWGATDMTAIFVGYNPTVFGTYFPDVQSMPPEKLRACIIGAIERSGGDVSASKTYGMLRSYNQFPAGEDLPNDALDEAFKVGNEGQRMTYLQAMQCLTTYIFLATLRRARAANKKLLIFEDGGYLHPILNWASLDGLTVSQLRERHGVPGDETTDAELPDTLDEALKDVFIGTAEWTRNGYDRTMAVQERYGRLAYPLFSMACSQLKTRVEGDSIALACLNAIIQVLYGLGLSVKHRHVMVLGSRGNIGRFFCDHVANMLDEPTKQLLSCDLKVDWPPAKPDEVPKWAVSPNARINDCLYEASAWKRFPKEYLMDVDLVFGLTGGPTVGQPTVNGDDVEEWLAHGNKRQIFFVSGSTKQDEFSDLLRWLDRVKREHAEGGQPTIGGRNLIKVTSSPVDDKLSTAAVRSSVPDFRGTVDRSFGTQFTFELSGEAGDPQPTLKTVYLLNNTMPVNFMFHGTPTEIIDYSMAQLVDITACLARRAPALETAEVFAVGYKRICTEGVFRAEPLDRDYTVPGSPGLPLGSLRQ